MSPTRNWLLPVLPCYLAIFIGLFGIRFLLRNTLDRVTSGWNDKSPPEGGDYEEV